ncbi:hypothetical protein FOCC_FOCC013323 [Frankliniella occidentalis]|nr:hypothetical protein FOCC_FOCC013323 [Frankliniella occidentalis]
MTQRPLSLAFTSSSEKSPYSPPATSSAVSISNTVADGWWIVQTTVRPWRASLRSTPTHCLVVDESRPLVGSSKNMTGGLLSSSRAVASLLSWPPDRLDVMVSRCSSSPSEYSTSSISGPRRPSLSTEATFMASDTVRVGLERTT